jgi:predicted ArsR family transcriptional regulator
MDRIAYRRMLSDMSHRHVTLAQLGESSGVRRQEVRAFIEMLEADGLLVQREAPAADSFFDTLRPLGGWFRRTRSAEPARR